MSGKIHHPRFGGGEGHRVEGVVTALLGGARHIRGTRGVAGGGAGCRPIGVEFAFDELVEDAFDLDPAGGVSTGEHAE